MSTPTRLLLAGIMGVIGASGCAADEKDEPAPSGLVASYRPGGVIERLVDIPMPELPCLPPADERLNALGPGCTETFAVTAGPNEEIDAEGATICVYTIQYTHRAGCVVGRPLVVAAGFVVAELLVTEWS